MAKYDPIGRYLKRRSMRELTLSFDDIERIIGALLPKAALQPHWWKPSDDGSPAGVQLAAWADAGYEAELLKGGEAVRFSRVRRAS